jgi:hypothetical protein
LDPLSDPIWTCSVAQTPKRALSLLLKRLGHNLALVSLVGFIELWQ